MHHVTRHMLGLYFGIPGGKIFRQRLSEISLTDKNPNRILDLVVESERYLKTKKLMVA